VETWNIGSYAYRRRGHDVETGRHHRTTEVASETEARAAAGRESLERFPPADGWYGHTIFVHHVDRPLETHMMRAIGPAQPEATGA
jgi:hypothetical protein